MHSTNNERTQLDFNIQFVSEIKVTTVRRNNTQQDKTI